MQMTRDRPARFLPLRTHVRLPPHTLLPHLPLRARRRRPRALHARRAAAAPAGALGCARQPRRTPSPAPLAALAGTWPSRLRMAGGARAPSVARARRGARGTGGRHARGEPSAQAPVPRRDGRTAVARERARAPGAGFARLDPRPRPRHLDGCRRPSAPRRVRTATVGAAGAARGSDTRFPPRRAAGASPASSGPRQARLSTCHPDSSRASTRRRSPSAEVATRWARSSLTPGRSSTSTSSSAS